MAVRSFKGIMPIIHERAWVDETALVVGDVEIGADSSIWPTTVVRGDVNYIRIGERTNIQDGCVLHVTHAGEQSPVPEGSPLIIGSDITVGHRAVLHACTIEDRCLIGIGAIVMDNAIVRSGAMVGAGALVTPNTDVEGGYLWLGAPARRVRPLTDQEKEYLEYAAVHYVKLKDQHQRY